MNSKKLAELAGGSLHRSLANAIGNPERVWCQSCGATQPIDASTCLRKGWPTCCGYTMTIDQPQVQAMTEGGG